MASFRHLIRPFPNINFKVTRKPKLVIIGAGNSTKLYWDIIYQLSKKYCTIMANPNTKDALVRHANYSLFLDDSFYQYNKHYCRKKIIVGRKINWTKSNRNIKKRLLYLDYNQTITNVNRIQINRKGYINHYVGNTGFASLLCAAYFRPRKIFISGFDGPHITRDNIRMPHYYSKKATALEIPQSKVYRNQHFLLSIIKYLHSHNIKIVTTTTQMWGIDFSEWCMQFG